MRQYPGRLYHATPSWVSTGARFHIRVRSAAQHADLTSSTVAAELIIAARRYHDLGHWWCELFLLMPDHAHAIVAFPPAVAMTITLAGWKRGTSRFQHVAWQEGFFDHRLRSDAESAEKWQYIRRNPVVKNLCVSQNEWPWWWSSIVPNPLFRGGAA
jgi:hypothetical protein